MQFKIEFLNFYSLFIARESFYKKQIMKCNITLIVLKRKNIFDMCINIDEKYIQYMY